jgi:hypothetical protein
LKAIYAVLTLVDLGRNKKAVSPAISTVILTGAIVTMLVVALPFARNFLDARTAEYEFDSMKQFMQTVAFQLDDVAWTIGRVQTMQYSSASGGVRLEPSALNYTVYVDKGQGYVSLANYSTGILLFNMPISKFSLVNGYHEQVFPSNRSFLQAGVSVPISHVYVVEKLPMSDGSFIRIVVAPSVRMLNSTVSTNVTKNYYKFYLPILSSGSSSGQLQTVTLAGNAISLRAESAVQKVKVHISFPKNSSGFDQSFFNFDSVDKEVSIPTGSTVELYTMTVAVSQGVS